MGLDENRKRLAQIWARDVESKCSECGNTTWELYYEPRGTHPNWYKCSRCGHLTTLNTNKGG